MIDGSGSEAHGHNFGHDRIGERPARLTPVT